MTDIRRPFVQSGVAGGVPRGPDAALAQRRPSNPSGCIPSENAAPLPLEQRDCSRPRAALVRLEAMLLSSKLRAAPFAVVLAASALGTPPADAQQARVVAAAEPPLRMTWESDDPACSGDDVSARALRMVSPGVAPRPLQARVEVRREGDQWLVRLQTESGELSGRRILRAESCGELQQAIALLLAMAMESKGDVLPPEGPAPPLAAEPNPPAPSAPPPVTAAPVTPAAPGDVADQRPSEDAETGAGIGVGWFVRLDGKAAYGLKPGLGLGVGATAGIRLGDFDVGASAAHWPTSRARATDRRGYMDLSRQDVGLRVCWNAWRAGALTLAPCAAPELTFFHYETKLVRVPGSDTLRPQPNVTASVDVRYALLADRVSLLISPGVTVGRVQPFVFRLDDGSPAGEPPASDAEMEEFYRTMGFGPRLELGVDARF